MDIPEIRTRAMLLMDQLDQLERVYHRERQAVLDRLQAVRDLCPHPNTSAVAGGVFCGVCGADL